MRAELARDAVEVAVGRLVPFETAGLVEIGVLERIVPGAFKDLEGLGDDPGPLASRDAVLQGEETVLHFLIRRIAGEAEAHRLAEVLPVVWDEVQRGLLGAQDVLCRVGAVAALEEHRIAVLARDVVGEAEGVGTEVGLAVLCDRADEHGGHGEEGGSLIEVVNDA